MPRCSIWVTGLPTRGSSPCPSIMWPGSQSSSGRLTSGGAVRMLPGFDPVAFATHLRRGVTVASMVPTMISRVLEVDPGPFRRARRLCCSGEGRFPIASSSGRTRRGFPCFPPTA